MVCDSCGSARVSAETVSGGSVVAMGVDGKDGIVAGKDGYAKCRRGLNCVRIVLPQSDARGSDLSQLVTRRVQPAITTGVSSRRRCPAPLRSARPSVTCWCMWCVLRKVVCRSWAAPAEVVGMVLDDLGESDDGTSGVPPMCFSMPTSPPSILSWHVLGSRAGEHGLEDDGHHAPADVFSFRFFCDLCVVCISSKLLRYFTFARRTHASGR